MDNNVEILWANLEKTLKNHGQGNTGLRKKKKKRINGLMMTASRL
jgi:hypothetical protein